MRFSIFAFVLLLVAGITGCAPRDISLSPSATADSQPIISQTNTFPGRFTSLNWAKPYRVVEKGNLANDDPLRVVGLWFITASEARGFEEYAQTAIQATLDLYSFYRNDFTAVLLIPQSTVKATYAQAFFASDAKGASGLTGSVPAAPRYWKARAMDDLPYDVQELAILELWQKKQAEFPNRNPVSSLSYDENALRQYIADTLRIPFSQTRVRSLKDLDYEIDQSFGKRPGGQGVLPDIPQSEEVLKSLSAPVEFSAIEKTKIGDLVIKAPPVVKARFEGLYQIAEKVSRDSRWMLYSSWRPYAQSEEYRQLLQFCQEKGQAVWPLLFRELDQESRNFAGGLVVDLTLPEYLHYLERTADDSQAVRSTPEGELPLPASSSNMFKYVESLLALL